MDTPNDKLLLQRTFTAEQWERRRLFLLTPAGRKAEEGLLRRISRDHARYQETSREEGHQRNRAWDERQIWLHSEEGKKDWRAEQVEAAQRQCVLQALVVEEREAKAAAEAKITEQFQERRRGLALEWRRQDEKRK